MITTVDPISVKMCYVLFTKMLQGGDTDGGTVPHKRGSIICG